ncbi:MAG: DUF4407 domain-containing protein [Cyclobacteriaceae bacterium]|nr:DUF4407 domain-containing protein [Cyclobacteriaceae bacterium]MCK5279676.1 DUF4407 domain-containing protein [Cyclobacteriaceae bacterium]
MKKVKYFFWLCSGANRPLLEKCPTEGSKYVGIGATIFFTGIFASLAGAYALFTVFENYFVAALFGIVWGLMIFNLDRYIVSSMRKEGNAKKEFYTALPRIILAVLISLVIAKPLEMKIFEKEINSELELMSQKSLAEKEGAVKQRYLTDKQSLDQAIENLKAEIKIKASKRDELRILAQQEADGTGGSMRRNAGPIYQIKKADADRLDQELNDLELKNQPLISSNYEKLKEIDAAMASEIQSIERGKMNGPAARMDALSNITAKSHAIWLANWFIIFLFIAVETAPVFVKLISPRGPYDHLLLVEEKAVESMMYEQLAKQNVSAKKRTRKYPSIEKEYIDTKLEASLNRS